MSCRVFEFWPDNWHRDWRPAGRGDRHRRGDCGGQEDGQILVSTPSTLQTKTAVKVKNLLMLAESSLPNGAKKRLVITHSSKND